MISSVNLLLMKTKKVVEVLQGNWDYLTPKCGQGPEGIVELSFLSLEEGKIKVISAESVSRFDDLILNSKQDYYSFEEFIIKGAKYTFYLDQHNESFWSRGYRKTVTVSYRRLLEADPRESLKRILQMLRTENPECVGKIYKYNIKVNEDFELTRVYGLCDQLKEGKFILKIMLPDCFAEAVIIEQIITMLLELEEFNEQPLRSVQGNIENKLHVSIITLLQTDPSQAIRGIPEEIRLGKFRTHYYTNGHHLLLTPEKVTYQVVDKDSTPNIEAHERH